MKRILFTILLAIFLAAIPTYASSKLNYKQIAPLQKYDENGALYTGCTAWASLDHGQRVWVTAGHCVTNEDNDPDVKTEYKIEGKKVTLIHFDGTLDVASLTGGPKTEPLLVSVSDAEIEDGIRVVGYPFGMDGPIYNDGVIANPSQTPPGTRNKVPYAIYQVPVAPGSSGSPVLSQDGKTVVGMIQGMICEGYWTGFCPVARGLTTQNLRLFLTGQPDAALALIP